MANLATTEYKITGTQNAVKNLWTALENLNVNKEDVYLDSLAEYYKIDYEKKCIGVRGHIYWAEYEEDPNNDYYLLSFETETAWDACNELFDVINDILQNELSISYRLCESGCEIYHVHDEGSFFPEKVAVCSNGELFEDDSWESFYLTLKDAINKWCEKMNIQQDNRTDEEMMDFINNYEYDNDDTYFSIIKFTIE
jgi:hypothetical protein